MSERGVRQIRAVAFVAVAISLIVGGCGGNPVRPSATQPSSLVANSSVATAASKTEEDWAVVVAGGTVIDATSGARLTGVAIQIPSLGTATTDARGVFRIEGKAPAGRLALIASGPNIITRTTAVYVPDQQLLVSVIPTSANAQAVDEMARSRAFDGTRRLLRWTQAPALIVETAILEDYKQCMSSFDRLVATSARLDASVVSRLVDRISRVLPILTAENIRTVTSVRQVTTVAGQQTSLVNEGAITVAVGRLYAARSDIACAATPTSFFEVAGLGANNGGSGINSDISLGLMMIGIDALARDDLFDRVVAHELGHALGYQHVVTSGIRSVMSENYFVPNPTEFDSQVAAISFRRPPGNQAPDIDPDNFSLNHLASSAVSTAQIGRSRASIGALMP